MSLWAPAETDGNARPDMTTSSDAAAPVRCPARRADEKLWPLPLDEDMRSKIDSDIADVRNISGDRWGGSITAGLFLREFVGDTPWVHLDIAGPAFAEKTPPIGPRGGTGFAVRTMVELLRGATVPAADGPGAPAKR